MEPDPQRHTLIVRRMRLLVVLLVLSNLFVGFYSIHLIRRTVREFSGLIGESVPVISTTRHAGQQAGFVFRSIVAGLVTRDPGRCSAMVERAKVSLESARKLRAQALEEPFLQGSPDLAREFRESGDAFDAAATQILPRVLPQNTADAERDQIEALQNLYERHIASVDKIIVVAMGQAETTSDFFSNENQGQTKVVLGLASWPLVVLGLGVTAAASIAVFMLFVFRQAVIVDEP